MSPKATTYTRGYKMATPNKISNISDKRKNKKNRTLDESAKAAARRFLNPDFLESIDEPEGLASGKASKLDDFINDENGEDV
jgi:hypothetical protein